MSVITFISNVFIFQFFGCKQAMSETERNPIPAYQIIMIMSPNLNLMTLNSIKHLIRLHKQVSLQSSYFILCVPMRSTLFTVDLIQEIESNGMGSPVPDFIDENFEEELAEACEENMDSMFCSSSYPAVDDPASDKYLDISKYGIVDVKGDDAFGRKIIVVYACKLPPVKQIDHTRFLRYCIFESLNFCL